MAIMWKFDSDKNIMETHLWTPLIENNFYVKNFSKLLKMNERKQMNDI